MTSQEIIDKLTELDVPTSVAQDQNNDPYTLLEKINYVLSKLEDIDKNEGTEVKVAGIYQKNLDFIDDPQDQITNLTDAVALNVEGIAHMNEIKQDKLSQTDLDNIAGLNQLQDKLDAKANQSEVTQLATAVENNTTEINSRNKVIMNYYTELNKVITAYYDSYFKIIFNKPSNLTIRVISSNPYKNVISAEITINRLGINANILLDDGTNQIVRNEYVSGSGSQLILEKPCMVIEVRSK